MAGRKKSGTNEFWRHNWKLVVNIVTLAALVGLVLLIWDQLVETVRNLKHVNLWSLLLIVPIEWLNYHSQTKLYQHLFRIVGNKLSYRFLFRASLELNFINHVFPSGGVSGISYFGLRMKDGHKLSASKATLVHIMKLMLVIVTFEFVLVAGLVFLAIGDKANDLMILVTGSLSTLLVLGTAAFTYIIGSQRRINVFFTGATKLINAIIYSVRPKHPETINIERSRGAFDEMHRNYLLFRTHMRELRLPALYALIASITELGALYAVYAAFGEYVNVGAVILAYAVANFAGLVSVLPGGIGIYEALMTGVLAAGGVPLTVSLPVTVMYRVVNTLIQIPPGFYFYQKALQTGEQDDKEEHGS